MLVPTWHTTWVREVVSGDILEHARFQKGGTAMKLGKVFGAGVFGRPAGSDLEERRVRV